MSRKMTAFKKANIFTFMMVVAVFAAVLRLVDIASYRTKISVAESTPAPQQFAPLPGDQPTQAVISAQKDAPPPDAALSPPDTGTAAAPVDAGTAEVKIPSPVASPYGEESFTAGEIQTLQSLSKRREELDRREQKIGEREALLKAAEGEVDRKIAELNKIRGQLEDLLGKQKTAEDERITSLVKIYENMKPKEAARIFDTLEMDVLLSVVGKMSERKTSPIFASMDPEKARAVTIRLAEQRNLPRLPEEIKKDKPAPASP